MADKREQLLPVPFPFAGIDLSKAYAAQPPSTTPTATNVRGFEPGSGRMRGGSRPGLAKYVTGQLSGGGLVQDLNVVVATGITPPGPPTPVVQTSAGGSGSSGTATDGFQTPVTAGNAILVLLGSNNIGSFPTVTDSLGNSYTRINSSSFSSYQAAAYLATGILGGTPTITAAVGTARIDLISFELSGTIRGRESGSSPQNNGTLISGVNWTAANAPDLVYVAVWTAAVTTITRVAGAGYTDVQTASPNFAVCLQRISANQTLGADLQWALSQHDQLQGAQGGIEV